MEKNVIVANNLTFNYEESSEGISDINFSINEGDVILLTGNSGCGKSTLLKCLNGLIPTVTEGELSGELSINGDSYSELKMHQINKIIGSVFQNPRSQFFTENTTAELVFPMENYGYEKADMQKRLEELQGTFGIHQLMNRNIYTLSSGERQMIALSSAVSMNQKILLFDEPSANLDYGNAMLLGKVIKEMRNNGYTIIVADHRFFYLNGIIDKVLFLDKGKLKLYDSEDEFKSSGYDTRSFNIFSLDIPFRKRIDYESVVASMKNVSFKNILEDINLELHKGEVTVLVGPNGAGKTTLAKLLCKTYRPTSGTVDTDELPFFIMQDPDYQLFGTSVINELTLVKNDIESIKNCLDNLGLLPYRHKHPFDLSGGQKQRLQIAMATLCEKPLIIFDEPTSGLDVYSMHNVVAEILKLKEKSGVLVISHDYEFIRHVADRVVFLDEGTIKKDFVLTKDSLSDLNNNFKHMQEERCNEKVED
ncbi:ABC transporter ATP-binding protein [Pseudobutyrivibrio xylanivorans]|uniref:Energy-coupling factor transport system ATP-binding protein n=1 Tax=Pseudobutyrivibrio xylanivorans TaxID=185007 RepID=A0A1G5S207_PSEXY|nr:ABC transporter ATP-binding protein [Pseudobutyrivibrio xylanivorans]SCZ79870.1 energy-coupling factor transport system ATP-binding protein [Pseudobutyrivibrio xylanivorans]